MAELITSELNIFFNQQGEIVMGGGLHIKLIISGTPTTETIQSLVDRVREWGMGQDSPEPLRERLETAPTEPPGDDGESAPGDATDAQCRKILAICHRLSDNVVAPLLKNYPNPEWSLDKDGHCIPKWGFLRSLKKQQASDIIQRLERAEA